MGHEVSYIGLIYSVYFIVNLWIAWSRICLRDENCTARKLSEWFAWHIALASEDKVAPPIMPARSIVIIVWFSASLLRKLES